MEQDRKYQSTAQCTKQNPGLIEVNENTWVPALVEFLQSRNYQIIT